MTWSHYWLTALTTMLALFVVPEAYAIKSKQKGDTLTENIRLWFRTDTPGGGWSWSIVWLTFAIVLGWLWGHILKVWQ